MTQRVNVSFRQEQWDRISKYKLANGQQYLSNALLIMTIAMREVARYERTQRQPTKGRR
jgi:hypothetical protein